MMLPRGNGTLKQLTRGQTKKGADRYAEPNDDELLDQDKGSSALWTGSIDLSKESAEGKASGDGHAPAFHKTSQKKKVSKNKGLGESHDSS